MSKADVTRPQSYVEQHATWLESRYPTLSLENRIAIAAQMAHSSVTHELSQSVNSLQFSASEITERLSFVEGELRAITSAIAGEE